MRAVTPELLKEVTLRLVKELNPEEIILFGSHAWGTPHKSSDIDLFIIVPDGIPNFDRIEWGVRADRCLDDLMLDVDIWVTKRFTIDRARKVFGTLEKKIMEQGKVLYGQRQVQALKTLVDQSIPRP